jgi:hypothetical protein
MTERKMRHTLFLLSCVFPAVCVPALAAPEVAAFYSNFCYNVEAGDVLGTRIGILNLSDATYVFFQEAEGIPVAPQVLTLKFGAMAGPSFTLRVDKQRVLRGTITDSVIDAHYITGYDTSKLHLKRMTIPQKGFADCK